MELSTRWLFLTNIIIHNTRQNIVGIPFCNAELRGMCLLYGIPCLDTPVFCKFRNILLVLLACWMCFFNGQFHLFIFLFSIASLIVFVFFSILP